MKVSLKAWFLSFSELKYFFRNSTSHSPIYTYCVDEHTCELYISSNIESTSMYVRKFFVFIALNYKEFKPLKMDRFRKRCCRTSFCIFIGIYIYLCYLFSLLIQYVILTRPQAFIWMLRFGSGIPFLFYFIDVKCGLTWYIISLMN